MSEILFNDQPEEENKPLLENPIDAALSKEPTKEIKTRKEKKAKIDASAEAEVATITKENNDGNQSTSGENARSEENRQVTKDKPEGTTPQQEAMVPSWRLREMREEYERKLADLEKKLTPQPQVQQPQVPNKETEYDLWLEHEINDVKSAQAEIRNRQALDELDRSFTTSVTLHKAKNPDFDNAINNMAEIYARQLAEDGLSFKQIQDAVIFNMRNLTVEALKKGLDPAEYIYRKASHLPRLDVYKPQGQVTQQVKKEPDLQKMAESRRINASLGGDAGESRNEIPKLDGDPVSIALSKEKTAEFKKQRDKILKHA